MAVGFWLKDKNSLFLFSSCSNKPEDEMPKVFVSGCFDMLHNGHIAFLEQAAAYGDLYVAPGSDATVYDLKGRVPVNNEL
jgi:cytidyltransferase-like protein